MFSELEFEKPFDTAYGVIKIPENMIFYRGYSTRHPVLSERFAYFSEKKVAKSYIKTSEYTMSAFTNTRVLRVLDVRFMMSILREMIYSDIPDESNLPVILSFGLCSLRHQIKLMNKRYPRPELRTKGHELLQKIVDNINSDSLHERQGVRIGETTNDAYTMAFLSVLFENFVDGFVSPRLNSPYHSGNTMAPELIIFNPVRSGINILSSPPTNVYKCSMHSIYMTQLKYHVIRYINNISGYESYASFHLQTPMVGGGNKYDDLETEIPTVEKINELWDDDKIQIAIKNGIAGAQKWKDKVYFGMYDPPVPTLQVAPWTSSEMFSTKESDTPEPPVPTVPVAPWSEGSKETRKNKTRKFRPARISDLD